MPVRTKTGDDELRSFPRHLSIGTGVIVVADTKKNGVNNSLWLLHTPNKRDLSGERRRKLRRSYC